MRVTVPMCQSDSSHVKVTVPMCQSHSSHVLNEQFSGVKVTIPMCDKVKDHIFPCVKVLPRSV